MYKVIVAHPGKQHSYRLASALKKQGLLIQYITTIYSKKSSWLVKFITFFLSSDDKKRAKKRHNPDLNDKDVTTFCEWSGLIEAFLVRIDKSKNIYRLFSAWNSNRFGVKVAKYAVRHKADIVICYDSNAASCFEHLKKYAPSIIRILDVSIAARPYMKKIYINEIRRSGHNDLQIQNMYMWNDQSMQKMQNEINNCHYFLAPSKFVIDSLIDCGVRKNQILHVPYGANIITSYKKEAIPKEYPIQFLFVGQVSYRKGIPILLKAFSELDSSDTFLTIVGEYNSNDWYIKEYSNNAKIEFKGLITFDQMKKVYKQSHVFVFPSFAEGMTLAGIEAMACGLPIICTYNSGISDLVKDGENGFIVEVGNSDSLVDRMKWFITNPEKIQEMGENAKRIASQFTWERYESGIVAAVRTILK